MRYSGFVCVGRSGDEYYFVESIFDHGDGFQGCTGCVVRPVSKEEYDWASHTDNVMEWVGDVWEELYKHKACDDCEKCCGFLDEEEGCENCGVPSLRDFAEKCIDEEGIENLMFDPSNCCEAEEAFAEMGVECECTDCVGCGRIFTRGMDFDEVFDRAALEAINDFEGHKCSMDYAVSTIFNV